MIVLDCSMAVEIVRGTVEGCAARSMMLSKEKVIAPSIFYAELASVFRKYVKAGLMDRTGALRQIDVALRLVDEFYDLSENVIESFSESLRLDHSSYDLFYFTLARRNAATLFTLDRSLVRLCEQEGVSCLHLVDL